MLQDVHSNIVQQKLARKYPLMIEGVGGDDAAKPLFYVIGNCAEILAASTETLKIIKRFGSGSGHWPFFDGGKMHYFVSGISVMRSLAQP